MSQFSFNDEAWSKLTPREIQVAKLAGEGLGGKQTASELGIADATVTIHRYRAMKKMGCTTFTHVVAMLIRGGII